MSNFYRNILLWVLIIVVMILVFNMFSSRNRGVKEMPYSKLVSLIDNGGITHAKIKGNYVYINYDNQRYKGYIPNVSFIANKLVKHNATVNIAPKKSSSLLMNLLIYWGPMILLVFLWFYFMNQMNKGGKVMSFGKSNARLIAKDSNKITFKDVAGVDEVKEELEEIIGFLKNPKKFLNLGARIPKGVLLVGAPGTGKTLLAKAVAGEAGAPFFSISGSDFVEMFVGVGASRVRDLFNQAKSNAPCIVFIDEIDAVGRQRGAGVGGGNDEREQTLNQLLVEMDGFQTDTNVIIMAATNRPDVLDPALLRPGRFDRRVIVPRPDIKGREEILKVHTKNIPLAKAVDLSVIAKSTAGFVGADLFNLVNEATLIAAKNNAKEITLEDLEIAKDKVLMGPERKNMIISDKEKRITAYHESGHAVVAKMLPSTDPVHKVSVIPRGMALGVTQQLPEDDKYMYEKGYLLDNLAVLMGGRACEETILHITTTGAGNDLDKATQLARKMVCEWGMSSLGPISYPSESKEVFLGRDMAVHVSYSEETAKLMDLEIKKTLEEAYNKARDIIDTRKNEIDSMVRLLLEKETITSSDIDDILGLNKNGNRAA